MKPQGSHHWREERHRLAEKISVDFFLAGGLKFGSFKLTSGIVSPYYIDLRKPFSVRSPVESWGLVKALVGALHGTLVNEVGLGKFDLVVGVPHASLPFLGALTHGYGIPTGYVLKEPKYHGESRYVYAALNNGDRIVLCDDVVTTGKSIIEAVEQRIEKQCERDQIHLTVDHAVVLVDRLQGGATSLTRYRSKVSPRGIGLHAFMTITEMMAVLLRKELVKRDDYDRVKEYVNSFGEPNPGIPSS